MKTDSVFAFSSAPIVLSTSKSYSQEIVACSRPFSGLRSSKLSFRMNVYFFAIHYISLILFRTTAFAGLLHEPACMQVLHVNLPSASAISSKTPAKSERSHVRSSPVVRWLAKPAPPRVLISSSPLKRPTSLLQSKYDFVESSQNQLLVCTAK